jgi:hypothetical protein
MLKNSFVQNTPSNRTHMTKTIRILATFLFIIGISVSLIAEESFAPYLKIGTSTESMASVVASAKSALKSAQFEILGDYSPEDNPALHVIVYSRNDLQQICLTKKDRGALASILKLGFIEKEGVITLSMLNPMYLFYAYLGDDMEGKETQLNNISSEVQEALTAVGQEFTPFGGSVETDDLIDYKFMAFMPKFDDPTKIKDFDSFEEGLTTIRKNLDAGKGNTVKVFELVFKENKTAIFGVGLQNKEEGEAHFLPIIGEDNIAAMPYEIILQGTEATILPGKYRLALHWPELTMGEFMKIMSTPGDIEKTLEGLTE